MQNQKEKLLGFSKKNILLTELAALFRIDYSDTKELYSLVTELGNQGLIKPVSASGKIANLTYPMYKKYKICAADEEYAADIKKILSLHPTITKSGYLSRNPKIYRENENFLAMLSKYFFTNRHAEYISRKERSYEIFGKEKELDNPTFKRLLNNLKITDSDLMFYDTPEYCFHDFIPERKEHMTLLICENKDIWFNIRRRMFEENMRMLFGTKIDGVVYGAGNKVSEKSGALIQYVRFMGKRTADFLYWGDIDREGFDIFKRTREVNAGLMIKLFVPGYKKMIKKAAGKAQEDAPSSKDKGNYDEIFAEFSEHEREFLSDIMKNNKLIPQEIISYTDLSEV